MRDPIEPETSPDSDQKARLEAFLAELMFITRKYRLLLNDRDESVEIIDMVNGRLLSLGLEPFTAAGNDAKVIGYVPVDSILDGAWLV